MAVESASRVADLNASWPLGSDPRSQGDDHIRLLKAAVKTGDFSTIIMKMAGIQGFADSSALHFNWSGSELQVRVDASVALLWSDLDTAFSHAGNGYHKFPNGFQVCWGVTGTTDTTITFPSAFPAMVASLQATPRPATGASTTQLQATCVDTISLTSFNCRPRLATTGGTVGVGGFASQWLAIGW